MNYASKIMLTVVSMAVIGLAGALAPLPAIAANTGCANQAQGAPQHVINNAQGAPQHVINNAQGAPQHVIENAQGAPQHVINNASGKPGEMKMASHSATDCR
jgi:hypothetical protein